MRDRLPIPCGTGKSMLAFWIAEALEAKTVVVVAVAKAKPDQERWHLDCANSSPRADDWLAMRGQ